MTSPTAWGLTGQAFLVDWEQHGLESDYEGADFFAKATLTLGPLPAGTHQLRAFPERCGPRYVRHHVQVQEVNALEVLTDADRGALHLYRAQQAALWWSDCASALAEVRMVEEFTGESDDTLYIRAVCAYNTGQLREALLLFEDLEERNQRKNDRLRALYGDSAHPKPGHSGVIEEIRRRLAKGAGAK